MRRSPGSTESNQKKSNMRCRPHPPASETIWRNFFFLFFLNQTLLKMYRLSMQSAAVV